MFKFDPLPPEESAVARRTTYVIERPPPPASARPPLPTKIRLAQKFSAAREQLQARDPQLYDEIAELLDVVAAIVNNATFR